MHKSPSIQRRRLLRAGALGSLGLTLPFSLPLSAQSLQWQTLDDDMALVRGAGGNVLVARGPDGVMMVDGGHADHADTLLELVSTRFGEQPAVLFNSHCHRDQVGCNALLGRAGARIVAHENTRLWLGTEIVSRWEDRRYPPLPDPALPNDTFYDYRRSQQLQFNEPVEYGYLPQGHTDGDIYVFFPQRNLLFAGGVVSPGHYPLLDYSTNGWIGGMIDSLERLLAVADDNTRIVASNGGVVGRAVLEDQLAMCRTVIESIGSHYYQGLTFQDFLDSRPSAEFDDRWGDPSLFLATAWEGTWGHITEVRRYARRR